MDFILPPPNYEGMYITLTRRPPHPILSNCLAYIEVCARGALQIAGRH